MSAYHINLPLTSKMLNKLRAGDRVYISGKVLVARDAAHKRFHDLLAQGKKLPLDLNGQVIYYMGPSPTPPGEVIGAAGPTTAGRMDAYTPELLDLGLKGMIGKGKRSEEVKESLKKNHAIYFSAVGGAGALLQEAIKENKTLLFEDLGPEAVLELRLEDFPAIVAIDSYGSDIMIDQIDQYKNCWRKGD